VLTLVTLVVLVIGAVATLGFMVYAGFPTSPSRWFAFFLFAAWALLPYALLATAVRWRPSNRVSHSVLGVAAALMSGFSILGLYSAFVAHPDPQSALVLVFLPLWQLVGSLPFLGMSRYLARRTEVERA
jgi:hypothetical protein